MIPFIARGHISSHDLQMGYEHLKKLSTGNNNFIELVNYLESNNYVKNVDLSEDSITQIYTNGSHVTDISSHISSLEELPLLGHEKKYSIKQSAI